MKKKIIISILVLCCISKVSAKLFEYTRPLAPFLPSTNAAKIELINKTGKDIRFKIIKPIKTELINFNQRDTLTSGGKRTLSLPTGLIYVLFWCYNTEEKQEKCCLTSFSTAKALSPIFGIKSYTRAPNSITLYETTYDAKWIRTKFFDEDILTKNADKVITIRKDAKVYKNNNTVN